MARGYPENFLKITRVPAARFEDIMLRTYLAKVSVEQHFDKVMVKDYKETYGTAPTKYNLPGLSLQAFVKAVRELRVDSIDDSIAVQMFESIDSAIHPQDSNR